jgi:hypothetical protein
MGRHLTRPIQQFGLLILFAAVLIAVEPAWKTKQVPQWDEEDARQVLTNSPWAKTVVAGVIPELTPAQRRDGGAPGGGKGGGLKALEGITLMGSGGRPRKPENTSNARTTVTLRWESAFPIRAAEMKAHELGAPDLEGNEYALAVYQVPGLKADEKTLAGELKRIAVLKRDGKKDLKPSRVEIFPQAGGLTIVVYLFPRSGEITIADERVEFVAQIGRLYLTQYFYPAQMEFQGKLAL